MNLETFFIEVKLQTDEIKKGVEQAHSQIEKLTNDFRGLNRSGDMVSRSFRSIAQSAVSMFAGFAGLHAILNGVSGALSQVRELGQASRELNVDVTALDAWGHAVQRVGGNAQSFQSSLRSLAEHLGTTNEIALRSLPRLADSFSRLNPYQARAYGKSLGLDLPTILLLQQGRREVEALITQQQKLGLVTKNDTEITRKFDNALYDASRAYQSFYRELAVPLLPSITTGLNYLIEHKDVVADAFKVMEVGAAALAAVLIRVGGPITATAAAITAIAAAYGLVKEDIKFLKEGKDSFIGHALGYRPNATTTDQMFKNVAAQTKASYLLNLPPQIFRKVGQVLHLGGSGEQKTEVNIANVNINTAATDADGIFAAAKGGLQNELSQLMNHVDNGVHI